MNGIQETVMTICVLLIGTEILCKLIPENDMIKFVRGLVVLILLISSVSRISHAEFNLSLYEGETEENAELSEYISETYQEAIQTETENYIKGLLAAAEVESEQVDVFLNMEGEGQLEIEKITVLVKYEVDKNRTVSVLKNVLGEDILTEVKSGG